MNFFQVLGLTGILGLLGAIGGAICNAIGSVISSVGSIVSQAAIKIVETVGPVLETVAKLVSGIAQILGILKPEENVEEIGAKATLSDKKPDDFDSYNDYINHLRNEIELDRASLDQMSDVERGRNQAVGCAIVTKEIEETHGIELNPEFLRDAGERKLSSTETKALMDEFKEDGDLSGVSSYLSGEATGKERAELGGSIRDAIQNGNPNMSTAEIEARFDEIVNKANS